jgi:peptidoglycan/LPS O-acetylase OafA/YrhL
MTVRQVNSHTRYDALDGMRGIAAVAVMLFHFTSNYGIMFLKHAPLAVDIFFILSGFVIAHSYGDRLDRTMTPREYLLRRIVRLYPLFLVGLLGGTAIWYLQFKPSAQSYSGAEIVNALVANALFLPYFAVHSIQDAGPAGITAGTLFPANPPAWSLFFEMVASVAFVFAARMKQPHMLALICLSYVALLICGWFTAAADNVTGVDIQQGWVASSFAGGFPRVLFGFFLGVFIYNSSRDGQYATLRRLLSKYFGNIYLLYFILLAIFMFPAYLRGAYEAFVVAVIAPCLVIAGASIRLDNPASRQVADFLGWISYPVYCLHWPVGHLVFYLSGNSHEFSAVSMAAAVAATLTVSVALTKYFDEPVRRYFSAMLRAPGCKPVSNRL